MRIVAVSGSLRRESFNSALLRAAADLMPPGVVLATDVGLRDIPPYDEDLASGPSSVERLRQAIAAADALLIATPEYNSSMPGHLKNALDWLSRPLATSPVRNKPAAVIGASTGAFGAVWAQAETRKVLSAMGARVLEDELPVPNADALFPAGRLMDADVEQELKHLLGKLAEAVLERNRAIA